MLYFISLLFLILLNINIINSINDNENYWKLRNINNLNDIKQKKCINFSKFYCDTAHTGDLYKYTYLDFTTRDEWRDEIDNLLNKLYNLKNKNEAFNILYLGDSLTRQLCENMYCSFDNTVMNDYTYRTDNNNNTVETIRSFKYINSYEKEIVLFNFLSEVGPSVLNKLDQSIKSDYHKISHPDAIILSVGAWHINGLTYNLDTDQYHQLMIDIINTIQRYWGGDVQLYIKPTFGFFNNWQGDLNLVNDELKPINDNTKNYIYENIDKFDEWNKKIFEFNSILTTINIPNVYILSDDIYKMSLGFDLLHGRLKEDKNKVDRVHFCNPSPMLDEANYLILKTIYDQYNNRFHKNEN